MEEVDQDQFSFHDPDDPIDMLLSSHRSPAQNNNIESERDWKQEVNEPKSQENKNSLVENLNKEIDQMWRSIEQKDVAFDKMLELRQTNIQNMSSRKGSGSAKLIQPQSPNNNEINHNFIKKILNNDPIEQITPSQIQQQKPNKDLMEEPYEIPQSNQKFNTIYYTSSDIEGTSSIQQPLENSEDQGNKYAIRQRDEKINQLQSLIDQLQQQLEAERKQQKENKQHNDQNEDKIEKLTNQLSQLTSEKEIIQSQKIILDKEYYVLQQDYQQLVSKFNQTKKEEQEKQLALLDSNRRLQIENNLLQSKFMQEEQASLQSEKLQIELQNYMQATQNLESENTQLRIQLEQVSGQQQKCLEQRLNSALCEINLLNEKMDSQRTREKQLEDQKKKLEEKIAKADIEYIELKRIHEEVKDELKKKREKLQQIQTKYGEKERELQKVQDKMTSMHAAHQQELEQQYKSQGKTEFSPNSNEYRNSIMVERKLEMEKQQIEQELINYKRLYEESRMLYEKTSENLQQHLMSSQNIENSDQLKETIASLQFDIQKLKLDNQELNRELIQENSRSSVLQTLEEQILQKQQESSHLDQLLQESRRNLLNFTEQNGYLKQRVDNLTSELGRQEQIKTKREDIITEQQHRIEDMTDQVAGLAQEIENLSKQNKQLSEQLCTCKKVAQQEKLETDEKISLLSGMASHFNMFVSDFIKSNRFDNYIQLSSQNFREMIEFLRQKVPQLSNSQQINSGAISTVEQIKRLHQYYSVLFTELEHQFKMNAKQRLTIQKNEEQHVRTEEKLQTMKKTEELFVNREKQLLEQLKQVKQGSLTSMEDNISELNKEFNQSRLIEEYKIIIKKLRQQNCELLDKQAMKEVQLEVPQCNICKGNDDSIGNSQDQVQHLIEKYEHIKYNYNKIVECLLKIIPNMDIINCTNDIIQKIAEIEILEQQKKTQLTKLEEFESNVKILIRNASGCDQKVMQLRKLVEQKREDFNETVQQIQGLKNQVSQLFDSLKQHGQVEKYRLENILNVEQEYIKCKKQNEDLQGKYNRICPITEKFQLINDENIEYKNKKLNEYSQQSKSFSNMHQQKVIRQDQDLQDVQKQRQALEEKDTLIQIQSQANIAAGANNSTIVTGHQRSQSYIKGQTIKPEKDIQQKRFSEKKICKQQHNTTDYFINKQQLQQEQIPNKLLNQHLPSSNSSRYLVQDEQIENSFISKVSLRDKLESKMRYFNVNNNQNNK